MWLGIDDTDSPRGGCTTWVLTELLGLAREHGVDLIGAPRLVRLNPNIPWKTRGNAALAARFGRGAGRPRTIGALGGRRLVAYDRGRALDPAAEAAFREIAWTRVLATARNEDGTDPAMVASPRALPARLYWNAVREVVPVEEVTRFLRSEGLWWRVRGDPRGLVGASAAIAWPGRRVTWEVTSYRAPSQWGSPRTVDPASVRAVARRRRGLFLCHDPRTRRVLVAPHTPCPILFGLRGTEPGPLIQARGEVRAEPSDRWVLFRTNQATGDHLAPRTVRSLTPFTSGRLTGTVRGTPLSLPGGHARLVLADSEGRTIDCVAFEPTKTLPRALRALADGDRVEVAGSRGSGSALRVESLRIVHLLPRAGPLRRPVCSACERTARSLGRGRGFRCPECRRRWPPEAARRGPTETPDLPRTVHPTASARRHLHPRAPEL